MKQLFLLLDVDEYLVPMGNYTSLKDVLRDAAAGGTNILSFRSSRGLLREDRTQDVDRKRVKLDNATFLETYNCDISSFPKPPRFDRARKQIYRSDHVLYRFVHYSLVTQESIKKYNEVPAGKWMYRYDEVEPSQRNALEMTEAVMIHTKAIAPYETRDYRNQCQLNVTHNFCPVGYAWPGGQEVNHTGHESDENGMAYNCYANRRVDEYWAPKLRSALKQRQVSMNGVKH
jgi:hypothetical protein